MAFTALIDLGTVGFDISGNTLSISGCTGASCASGCSSLATSQNVNDFPKQITSIPDTVVSLYIKVDNGPCSGTTQCIGIDFGSTPTPTSTPTSTSTVTDEPGVTLTPTTTPTTTITETPTTTISIGDQCIVIDYFYNTNSGLSDGCGGFQRTDTTIRATLYDFDGGSPTNATQDITISFDADYSDCLGTTSTLVALQISTGSSYGETTYTQYSYDICPFDSQCNPISTTVNGVLEITPAGYSECSVATPTPTNTPTITPPTVYTFYRASEVLESNVSTTYCNNFGPPTNGQGYVMSQPFYTIDSVLTPGTTVIYSDSDLTTVDSGSWEYNTNETLIAYINQSEYDTIPYRTTTDPDGDGTYSGGAFKYIRVDSSGTVQDSGTYSCEGGSTPF